VDPACARTHNDLDCFGPVESNADYERERKAAETFLARASRVLKGPAATTGATENAVHYAQLAEIHYRCAGKAPGHSEMLLLAEELEAQRLKSALSEKLSHACANRGQEVAAQAATQARNADSLEDAESAAKLAMEAAALAELQRSKLPDKTNTSAAIAARTSATLAHRELSLRKGAEETICGKDSKGRPGSTCLSFGVFGAMLSYLWVWNASSFTSRPRFADVVVPAVAGRWEPWSEQGVGWVALEVGAYTTFLSRSLVASSPTTTKMACNQSASEYEKRLPCEANSAVYPYMAGYVGATFGRAGLGYLTIAPLTLGVAQVGSRQALRGYFGTTVGALQINGRF